MTAVPTLVIYRPKAGKEGDLEALVRQHGPVLAQSGLTTKEPVRAWRATDKRSGAKFLVETFEWRDEAASGTAHQLPEIMAVWEPMGLVLESMTIAALEPIA